MKRGSHELSQKYAGAVHPGFRLQLKSRRLAAASAASRWNQYKREHQPQNYSVPSIH
jgi:hypothetical protein